MELQLNSAVSGKTLTVEAIGKLNTNTAPEMEAYINNNFRMTLPLDTLVLDLSRLTYISSAGLRVIMAMQKIISGQRYGTRELVLRNPSPFCMQVFETVGVSAFFKIQQV